jgi:hypothetical protein
MTWPWVKSTGYKSRTAKTIASHLSLATLSPNYLLLIHSSGCEMFGVHCYRFP